MKDRELEARVVRFVRELGIATSSKVRRVGFDLADGVVIIDTHEATYLAPADSLWSDYADNEARIRPKHAVLKRVKKGIQSRSDLELAADDSDTSTCPAPAAEETRAATCTARAR